jgi:hypothetical protein
VRGEAASHPYELFINCLPLSYATERNSIGMRKVINQNRLRQWEAAGGVFCFLAGIVAALLGSLLTAGAWIVGAQIHPWVHAAGTALLIVTIPLILFAGFCLDWSERRPNNARDNDRDPGQGKVPPEPIMISKEIERGVNEAGVTLNKEIRLVAGENGNGVYAMEAIIRKESKASEV